jgi:hypothetical protein
MGGTYSLSKVGNQCFLNLTAIDPNPYQEFEPYNEYFIGTLQDGFKGYSRNVVFGYFEDEMATGRISTNQSDGKVYLEVFEGAAFTEERRPTISVSYITNDE